MAYRLSRFLKRQFNLSISSSLIVKLYITHIETEKYKFKFVNKKEKVYIDEIRERKIATVLVSSKEFKVEFNKESEIQEGEHNYFIENIKGNPQKTILKLTKEKENMSSFDAFRKIKVDFSKYQVRPPIKIKQFFADKEGVYDFYILPAKDSDEIFHQHTVHWVDKKKYKCYGTNCARCADGIEKEYELSFLMYIHTSTNPAIPANELYLGTMPTKMQIYLMDVMKRNNWDNTKFIRVTLGGKLDFKVQEFASKELPDLSKFEIPTIEDIAHRQRTNTKE